MRELGGVAVVTGGAGGIGRALGRALAERGAKVALLDLRVAAAREAAAELEAEGHQAIGLACDVTDPAACARAIAKVQSALGDPTVLVANAGIGHRSAFADTGVEVLRRVMDVNYFGAVNATHAALPSLVKTRGRIVVISSVAGFAPLLGRSGYAAAKHALHGLFDTLRGELAPDGVSVTIACPSFTESGFEKATLGADGAPVGRPRSKVGALADPNDVARAIVRAAIARRRLLVLAPVGKASLALTRLWPGAYERLMARMLRSEIG